MSRAALLASVLVLTTLVAAVSRPANGAGVTSPSRDEKLIQAASREWPKFKKARYQFVFHDEWRPQEAMKVAAGNEVIFLKNSRVKISPFWQLHFPTKDRENFMYQSSPYMELEFDRPVNSLKDMRSAKLRMMKYENLTIWCGPPEKRPRN